MVKANTKQLCKVRPSCGHESSQRVCTIKIGMSDVYIGYVVGGDNGGGCHLLFLHFRKQRDEAVSSFGANVPSVVPTEEYFALQVQEVNR